MTLGDRQVQAPQYSIQENLAKRRVLKVFRIAERRVKNSAVAGRVDPSHGLYSRATFDAAHHERCNGGFRFRILIERGCDTKFVCRNTSEHGVFGGGGENLHERWGILGFVIEVAVVIATENVGVEGRPRGVVFIERLRVEGVACRANAHEWLPSIQVLADQSHHLLRGRATPHTDDEQVSGLDSFKILERVAARGWSTHERALESSKLDLLLGKFRQRFPRIVFVFADDKYDVRTLVIFELKRFAAEDVRAGN